MWILTELSVKRSAFSFQLASFLTFTWQFGEILCKVVYYFQNVSAICSVTTLTTMSMER